MGAAAVLCKAGCGPKTLKLHLGSLEEHTTFEAEAASLSLALHLLSLERNACSATRAQHEYKYFHGYLWVHPWENLYKQITCVQVPGA